jgi:ribose transport system substrate-binding protein
MVAAAKTAGWSTHVVDGKLNPVLWTQGITQAVAAGASAVIAVSVDCDNATTALDQAKAAHVLTETYEGFDCNDPGIHTGPALYSTAVAYQGVPNIGAYFEAWGASRAAWIINATHNQAQVIDLGIPSVLSIKYEDVGFLAEMSQCSTCKVVDDVPIALTDLSTNAAAQKFATALEQYPNANSLNLPTDSFFPEFANSVLKSINRPSLQIMGGECLPNGLTEIASGGTDDACSAIPDVWLAWAAVDEMNRQFASPGSAPVNEGLGFQLVDKTHNMPANPSAGWTPVGVNFQQDYTNLWNG